MKWNKMKILNAFKIQRKQFLEEQEKKNWIKWENQYKKKNCFVEKLPFKIFVINVIIIKLSRLYEAAK